MILASEGDATYWYEGICPYSGEFLRLPRTSQAEAIARDLMQELSKPNCGRLYLSQLGLREGKMYGVLLAESPTGERIVLKAFSGLLNGESQIAGWVPPIAGREKVAIEESITLSKLAAIKQELIDLSQIPERLEYERRSREYETQLQVLQDRHQISKQQRQLKRSLNEVNTQDLDRESQLEKMVRQEFKRDRDRVLQPLKQAIADADERMQILKKQRRELSRTLQTQMHDAYVLTNFAGETRSLRQLIAEGSMPTGMGDCCAPKLLHYAATHNLTPLAMAEFWCGNPSPDGYKIQGEFYGACVERCQPLMGFLLSGRRSPPAPLNKRGEENQVPLFKGDLGGSLRVIYEDEYLIAIAKPAGLLSVPGRYLDTQDSVLSRLRQSQGDKFYPAHRLDRQTSGILLLARDLETLRHLHNQFQERQIRKIYEALLSGKIESDRGTIDLPLWGNPENRPYQQVDWQRGKPSVTQFQLLRQEENHSRIEFIPLTGRTHQLRVHSADPRGLGMTILGDRLYGCQAATSRLHLHARELSFAHPRTQELIHLQIPVPF
ncbi:MAG: RNA pseudouridine synthase [Pseudanabaena frigida]|uniref:RNA pseudouridylate synthase n=1 Tax=Pseudanabaena frigida TaxID=945775 RepID=A0A2W4W4H0_9CYAN|nr:MAG: RNA pseudouridine synthase [Pseudanabaena frigida]